MGNSLKISNRNRPEYEGAGDVGTNVSQKRKRSAEELETTENLQALHASKRKQVKSTSKYIYQTLFLDGENSDVTLHACGTQWKLHKLYLKQSLYFASMFGGAWVESDKDFIDINIVDDNITAEALGIAFGSLYKDDVLIKPVQIPGVVAAASHLQLDALLQLCVIMMKDTLSAHTVIDYHACSCLYDLEEVKELTFTWLTNNLLITKHITFIKDICIDLMVEILSSPDLIVMQVEIDLYSLLKKWIFMLNNPTWTGESASLLAATNDFFANKITDRCYLETEEGRQYFPAFAAIRWQHVVNDITSIKTIEKDRLLPVGMLEPISLYNLRQVLEVDQGHDKGPEEQLSEATFDANCTRCGRMIPKLANYCWRWVGYSYGVDLLISITSDGKLVAVKRNTYGQTCQQAVSLADTRHIAYRMTLTSLDENGNENYSRSTDIEQCGLARDQEKMCFIIDKDETFPLALSMNVVYVTPSDQDPPPRLKLPGD